MLMFFFTAFTYSGTLESTYFNIRANYKLMRRVVQVNFIHKLFI